MKTHSPLGLIVGVCAAALLFGSSRASVVQPQEIWHVAVDGAVYGAPTIAPDGTVYVGTAHLHPDATGDNLAYGKVYSLNPNGTTNWVRDLGGAVAGTLALGRDGTLYAGVQASNGRNLPAPQPTNAFYALYPDGTTKWSMAFTNAAPSEAAIASDDSVYFTVRGLLYSVAPNGTLKWTAPTCCASIDYTGSPSIGLDGTIYVGGWDLTAVSPDGRTKWVFPAPSSRAVFLHSSPAIGWDGTIYLGNDDGQLYAINGDGTLRWTAPGAAFGFDGSASVGVSSICFGPFQGFYSVSMSGQSNWSFDPFPGGIQNSTPAFAENGRIYWGKAPAFFQVEPDGTPQSMIQDSAHYVVCSSPTISQDGTLYVATFNGDINDQIGEAYGPPGIVHAYQVDVAPALSSWPMHRANAQHTGRTQLFAAPGQVEVNNRVGQDVYAPISMPDGGPPPPGAQAQVWRVLEDGALVPLKWLKFRNDDPITAAWYFFAGTGVLLPDVPPGGQATFRIRAWVGADWNSASFRGESDDSTVTLGGGMIPPPNLPINPFTLWRHLTMTISVPENAIEVSLARLESSTGKTVVIQTSVDLITWTDLQTRTVTGATVSFDALAEDQARFYRVKLP